MNRKPIIGIIPTYNLDNPNNDPYEDRVSFVRMYIDKIVASGGIPVGILDDDVNLYKDMCDGYLWPGGTKVNQAFFTLIDDAIKKHKPLLGICLGAQAISIAFNLGEDRLQHKDKSLKEVYTLNKDVNPYLIKLDDIENHSHFVTKDIASINAAKHWINIEPFTFLYDIYKEESLQVVSLHSYGINRTSDNIIISAKKDDVIEAIEYHENGCKILGVQFHPEILEDNKIFDWLIKNCHKE